MSAPLLWIGPLALYLASFVVAFSGRGGSLVRWATVAAPAAATLLWVPLGSAGIWPLVPLVTVELVGFGVVATALHGRLAADRPGTRHLTEFYLVLAAAGVLAGGFVALVAPAIFPDVWEYPLLVGSAVTALALTVRAAGAVRTATTGPTLRRALSFGPFVAGLRGRLGPYLVVAAVLLVSLVDSGPVAVQAGGRWILVGGLVLLLGGVPRFFALATAFVLVLAVLVLPPSPLFRDRSFFGVTLVLLSPDGERREILNGTTLHGVQYLDAARRSRPATYHVEDGPVGAGRWVSSASARVAWPRTPKPPSAGRTSRSTRSSSGWPRIQPTSPTCAMPGRNPRSCWATAAWSWSVSLTGPTTC